MSSQAENLRKRRTRSHVIEERSLNYLERQVLARNHQLHRASQREYGWDATMFHFSDEGFIENGEIRFQVKATDEIQFVDDGKGIAVEIETRDLRYWIWEIYPFVLIVYDARSERAYWLHVQDYVPQLGVEESRDTIVLRIPARQRLNRRAIDHFRGLSLRCVETSRTERNPRHERRQ